MGDGEMAMKMIVTVRPGVTIELAAEKQKDLFKAQASAVEVFGERKCGLCGSTDIIPVWRTATKITGKNVEEFEFPEMRCHGWIKGGNGVKDSPCRAKLCYGTINDASGDLFPIRRLVEDPDGTGMRPATKVEKDAGNQGEYGSHNGWHRYIRPEPQDGTGRAGNGNRAPAQTQPAAQAQKPTPAATPAVPITDPLFVALKAELDRMGLSDLKGWHTCLSSINATFGEPGGKDMYTPITRISQVQRSHLEWLVEALRMEPTPGSETQEGPPF